MTGWPAAPSEAAVSRPAGEFVIRTEPHTEADPMALLIQFLVAFGVAAGRRATGRSKQPATIPTSSPSSSARSSKGRKGSAWDHVEAVLADADRPSPATGSCPG